MEKNYSVMKLGSFSKDLVEKGRIMAEESLGLTGCELSFNHLQPNTFTPFTHAHKQNEEVYIILSGNGEFMIDHDEFNLEEGDIIRIATKGERAIKARDRGMSYICIQVKENSLEQATSEDGIHLDTKASWMK